MRWLGLVVLSACSFEPGRLATGDAGELDGDAPDAPADACVAGIYVDTCTLPAGTTVTVTGTDFTYDTDSGELRDAADALVPHTTLVDMTRDPHLRIIAATDFAIEGSGSLTVTGSLPLAIVASGTISITGELDAGAHRKRPGPGAPAMCVGGASPGANDGGGAAGGGGGGFGAAGGDGGNGDANGGMALGGAGGPALAIPTTLRGGCPGAKGGDGPDPGGGPGGGGGAVLLVAQTVSITGIVRAGGGGGEGGFIRATVTPLVGGSATISPALP